MPVKHILFGFKGRIGRRDWWVYGILIGLAQICLSFVLYTLTQPGTPLAAFVGKAEPALSTILMLALLWPTVALTTQRMHDRGKSGWLPVTITLVWNLIDLVRPFAPQLDNPAYAPLGWGLGLATTLYLLIALGILAGTPGANRFGPSPDSFDAYPRPSM